MVLSALGFCVLDGRRSRPEAEILMRIGAFAYLTGSIVGVVAETLELAGAAVYPAIVAYVTLAFAGQDIIGGALVASALIPRWIGWATVLWNLAWLASLIIARPGDIYFPILHLVMPVVIGAALLRRPTRGRQRTGTAPVQAPASRS